MSIVRDEGGVIERVPALYRSSDGSVIDERVNNMIRFNGSDPYWNNVELLIEGYSVDRSKNNYALNAPGELGISNGVFPAADSIGNPQMLVVNHDGRINFDTSVNWTFEIDFNYIPDTSPTFAYFFATENFGTPMQGPGDVILRFSNQLMQFAHNTGALFTTNPNLVEGRNVISITNSNSLRYLHSNGIYLTSSSLAIAPTPGFSFNFIRHPNLSAITRLESLNRVRFTRGVARYSNINYTVQDKWYPFDIVPLDPYWPETVFCLDLGISDKDLTGRHSITWLNGASWDQANGATSVLGNSEKLVLNNNLSDFIFSGDFTIEFEFIVVATGMGGATARTFIKAPNYGSAPGSLSILDRTISAQFAIYDNYIGIKAIYNIVGANPGDSVYLRFVRKNDYINSWQPGAIGTTFPHGPSAVNYPDTLTLSDLITGPEIGGDVNTVNRWKLKRMRITKAARNDPQDNSFAIPQTYV